MMRAFFFVISMLSLLSPATVFAQGANNLYVGFFAGATYFNEQEIEDGGVEIEIEYDFPGYVIGGQIGYQLSTNIRVEGEVAYGESDGDVTLQLNGVDLIDAAYDFSIFTATTGVYFDLWPLGSIVPYIGAGLGYAYVENEVNDVDDTQNALTAYGEGGVPLQLTPELSLVPSVRFSWVGTDDDINELFADDLFGTQARLGLRYNF